jgi:hypothetical protein
MRIRMSRGVISIMVSLAIVVVSIGVFGGLEGLSPLLSFGWQAAVLSLTLALVISGISGTQYNLVLHEQGGTGSCSHCQWVYGVLSSHSKARCSFPRSISRANSAAPWHGAVHHPVSIRGHAVAHGRGSTCILPWQRQERCAHHHRAAPIGPAARLHLAHRMLIGAGSFLKTDNGLLRRMVNGSLSVSG